MSHFNKCISHQIDMFVVDWLAMLVCLFTWMINIKSASDVVDDTTSASA